MSVVKSSRGQGLGRQLIERVISTNEGEPITLEALSDSKGFFEKVGFKSKSVSLGYGITAMYLNGDGSDELFKFLTPSAKQLEFYGDRYVENCKRLGMYPLTTATNTICSNRTIYRGWYAVTTEL